MERKLKGSECAEEILQIRQRPTICGLLTLIGELGRQMKKKGRDEMGTMRKWEWLSKWIPQSRLTPPQPNVDQAAPIFGKLKHN